MISSFTKSGLLFQWLSVQNFSVPHWTCACIFKKKERRKRERKMMRSFFAKRSGM